MEASMDRSHESQSPTYVAFKNNVFGQTGDQKSALAEANGHDQQQTIALTDRVNQLRTVNNFAESEYDTNKDGRSMEEEKFNTRGLQDSDEKGIRELQAALSKKSAIEPIADTRKIAKGLDTQAQGERNFPINDILARNDNNFAARSQMIIKQAPQIPGDDNSARLLSEATSTNLDAMKQNNNFMSSENFAPTDL